MKVHYINILLFAVPLNILVTLCHENTHKKPSITLRHIQTTRLLCECELFAPQNYDNDPEMKSVMQQFHDRTTQRFQEYDERLQEKRQICKDTCDKGIQKIILKDKIEKELTEKFSSLHTDIQSDDIPTCICEKSLADKVEKGCLSCGGVFGGGVMPGFGAIGGTALYALNQLKPAAITAAKDAAAKASSDAAIEAGFEAVVSKLKAIYIEWVTEDALDLSPIVNKLNFKCPTALIERAKELFGESCIVQETGGNTSFCNTTIYMEGTEYYLGNIAKDGATTYETTLTTKTTALTKAKVGSVKATYAGYHTSIIASIVAIVVIVLIMVIIYLILRYRRKKKMKKKLQYIKLLEE
ncbi:PIR protein, putative [Plasmodium sp.]|nr:PIR protein, putative [Plasmodium sp.]